MTLKTPAKNYVILDDMGQMGNKLVIFAHLAALCIETGSSVAFPSFTRHTASFENFKGHKNPYIDGQSYKKVRSGSDRKITRLAFRILRKLSIRKIDFPWKAYSWMDSVGTTVEYDINLSQQLERNTNRKTTIGLFGWRYRNQLELEKHAEPVRELFTLEKSIDKRAKQIIEEIKRKDQVEEVLAIHFRGGDYRQEFGGDRFISLEKMLKIARDYEKISESNFSIVILSNEDVKIPKQYNIRTHSGPGDQISDFAVLKNSDKIIAPMSTFSAFASFLGLAPLALIDHTTKKLNRNDFQVIQYFGPKKRKT